MRINLRGKCYLGICLRNKQDVKRALLNVPGVYRITDHGGHIKINTTKRLPTIRNLRTVLVRDRTKHFDARYWDFAMEAFRHAEKRKHGRQPLGIMIHYLCNLFGETTSEAAYLAMAAAQRAYIDATVSDEDAHGWELPYVQALRKAANIAQP